MSIYPDRDIDEAFVKAQQDLVDKFKDQLKKNCEDVLGTLYADVSNYACSDAHMNYYNYLKDHFRASLIREITEEWGHYSWAHSIRKELVTKYADTIKDKFINDLKEEIQSLNEHIEQLRKFK